MLVDALHARPPQFARIRAALAKWFPRDAHRRWSLLTAHRLFRVPTAGRPILAAAVGCSRADAVRRWSGRPSGATGPNRSDSLTWSLRPGARRPQPAAEDRTIKGGPAVSRSGL